MMRSVAVAIISSVSPSIWTLAAFFPFLKRSFRKLKLVPNGTKGAATLNSDSRGQRSARAEACVSPRRSETCHPLPGWRLHVARRLALPRMKILQPETSWQAR